ncbi:MAG: transglycosylase SLT domain-containing protein [Solirubrobacteraceae bacterium]
MILLIAVVVAATRSSAPPPPPLPGTGQVPRSGDPFAYSPAAEASFVQRATAGSGQVLFTKSPGGALATAARVAAYRGTIDAATRGTGIDPSLVEALVFVESAGRPDVIAGSDPSAAAGLTQILADTGSTLLGMHIDLARSRRLLTAIGNASSPAQVSRLLTQLGRADDRFDPRKAVAATVRYLRLAEQKFGREDLAVVSYHMGIGNLQQVLAGYDGGRPVPYAQLYFDTSPDNHAATFRLLSGFGDQSSRYFWRVLGAAQVMRLYRSDRSALKRLAGLETGYDSTAQVLHPPDREVAFADPAALSAAYARRTLAAAWKRCPARARLQPLDGRPRAPPRRPPRAVSRAAPGGPGPARRTRRPRPRPVRLFRAADRSQHGAGYALPRLARCPGCACGDRLHIRDHPPVRQRRASECFPGHARPPPGAQPDRVGAASGHDRGDGGG